MKQLYLVELYLWFRSFKTKSTTQNLKPGTMGVNTDMVYIPTTYLINLFLISV